MLKRSQVQMPTQLHKTVDCAVHNSVAAQQLFRRLFLQGERLQHLLATVCNACGPQQSDPITHITHLLLTQPVQCAISAAGLLPFRAHPELLYPFAVMDEPQKAFLRALQTLDNRAHAKLRAQMGWPHAAASRHTTRPQPQAGREHGPGGCHSSFPRVRRVRHSK
jgi:hypothetical protein